MPTLAASLAQQNVAYRLSLLDVLRRDPNIGHYAVELQVAHLLEKPLRDAFGDNLPPLIFVVDALDECSDPKAMKSMLSTLISYSRRMPIKFFLTSRPEQHIQSQFGPAQPEIHSVVRLHDIEQHIVESDIKLYCTQNLRKIRDAGSSSYIFLPDWPSEREVTSITKLAGKLFIYAFTAMQFIAEENPVSRLQGISQFQLAAEQPLTGPLDDMYSLVLNNALNSRLRTMKEISDTKQLLAILLTLRGTLSVSTLGTLIGITVQDIRTNLGRLRAVIYMPIPSDNDSGAVTTFHASFEDYLTTPGRAPETFRVDLSSGHEALATACIRMMTSGALRFNVSNCRSPYLSNSEQSFAPIPIVLLYSCLQWVHHLIRVPDPSPLFPLIDSFLQKKTLFWIEVLSASENAKLAVGLLHRVLTAENMRDRLSREMAVLLRDAKEFVMLGREAIEFSAPHIYLSVLPSLSPSSIIAKTFWPQFRNVLTYKVIGIRRSQSPVLQMSGHTGVVMSVAFSPDGTRIASGSRDGTVRIWDARTGDMLMDPLEGHDNTVTCVAFSPDGTQIASCSFDRTIRLWNARTGELVMAPLEGHEGMVRCVAFSPDGTQIVSGSWDSTLRLWDAGSGCPLGDAIEGHTGIVSSVMFSPNGLQVVSASHDQTIRLWDVMTRQQVMEPLSGHTSMVQSVAFSYDGTQIVSGSNDGTIRLWDARTGAQIIDPLVGHNNPVLSVAFSLDATRIASGSADKTVRVWDAAKGRPVMQPFEGHADHVWSVGFSPNGSTIVSGSGDKTIRLWSADPRNMPLGTLHGHANRVPCVVFTPDGTQIVSGSEDKTISLWNAQTGAPILPPLQGHDERITCLTVSPDGSCIASGSDDKTICLWSARTGERVRNPLSRHESWVQSLVFLPDGTQIVSGSSDGTIRIWDAGTGRLVMGPLEAHSGTIWSVAISPDGSQLVSGSADSTLQLWNATTGEQVSMPFKGHSAEVYSVAFSPDGAQIVSGSQDSTVQLWDARTGNVVMEPLRGHTESVLSVTFSPNGKLVASGSYDATVWLWNAATGVPVMEPLEGHSDAVHSIAFSPDGTRLVSGSADNTIRVWDVTPGDSWLGSQGGQGGMIWSAIASSFGRAVAMRSAPSLEPNFAVTSQPSQTSQADDEPHEMLYLDGESGWIKGPHDELIMWIPKDYWRGVLMPRTRMLIGQYRATLDGGRFVHGDRWMDCYTPNMTSGDA
ncbi:hypothetical protein CERSUDRAFT_49856 [Gelatoporia subvermispora B]|uniref:Nephrocystin 3-like N-terminal domain-containing protein n=1 Tax=Ceriporiopsis subvermispora (strain B) TaxID=914234 RepID=M2QZ43_CERS8|nr:hypothetical protein CERSUDRAFT_49856 [Gelatoporia subvermispora B]